MSKAEPIEPRDVLAEVLKVHQQFIKRCYELLDYIEEELERRHEYRRVRWLSIPRNGSGLAEVQSYVGLAFIAKSVPTRVQRGSPSFRIPKDGLRVLLFQIRWLEKASGRPPVVGAISGDVRADHDETFFDSYYGDIFNQLEADEDRHITSFTSTKDDRPIQFSGRYQEVPLLGLATENDVNRDLIMPEPR